VKPPTLIPRTGLALLLPPAQIVDLVSASIRNVTRGSQSQNRGGLKQFFEVAHIHFNNASCVGDVEPFPSWAYEVLFVSKRLAVVEQSSTRSGLHPFGARNNASLPECLPKAP
jgi:hypothetical protein